MAGLLPQDEIPMGLLGDPRNMALLSAAAALLEGGGPSLTPTSFGQNLGRALTTGMGAYRQGLQQATQNALMKRQFARQDKADARQEALDAQAAEDRNRKLADEERLRQLFPTAFNADGSVNPASIQQIAAISPQSAQALAGMITTQAPEPKYQVVEITRPDGTKQKGRIDVNAADPQSTFTPIGEPAVDPIPVEAAGRLGLAQSFLNELPEIRKGIEAGELTGGIDVATARQGIGTSGRLYARIESGVDALRRTLTGAGMPMDEAAQYVRRYQPSYVDTKETLQDKMNQLEMELKGNINAIMRGRGGGSMIPQTGWSIQAVE